MVAQLRWFWYERRAYGLLFSFHPGLAGVFETIRGEKLLYLRSEGCISAVMVQWSRADGRSRLLTDQLSSFLHQ